MTAESTFQALRCFADVLSTTTPGFSCDNINKIWTISVNVFVDFNAVFVTIDGGCYSWLAWDMVACQASPSIARRYIKLWSILSDGTNPLAPPSRIPDLFMKSLQQISKPKDQCIKFACTGRRLPTLRIFTLIIALRFVAIIEHVPLMDESFLKWHRYVMITQEMYMCPIRAENSTYKHLGKCNYLLFVWLAVIGFRQHYTYILPHFGDFRAICCYQLLPNWTLIPILTLLPDFGGFHRTLQRVRLANRGRLLLRTPGPVPFGTCICSNGETILSWTSHVYGPFEFRTSLGTSILLFTI